MGQNRTERSNRGGSRKGAGTKPDHKTCIRLCWAALYRALIEDRASGGKIPWRIPKEKRELLEAVVAEGGLTDGKIAWLVLYGELPDDKRALIDKCLPILKTVGMSGDRRDPTEVERDVNNIQALAAKAAGRRTSPPIYGSEAEKEKAARVAKRLWTRAQSFRVTLGKARRLNRVSARWLTPDPGTVAALSILTDAKYWAEILPDPMPPEGIRVPLP